MQLITKVLQELDEAGGVGSLIISLMGSIIFYLTISLKDKIKGNSLRELGRRDENREIKLLRKTILASIIGLIMSLVIVIIAIVIIVPIYCVCVNFVQISDYMINVLIGLLSAILFTIFSLEFGENIREAPYTFCKYRMTYLLF